MIHLRASHLIPLASRCDKGGASGEPLIPYPIFVDNITSDCATLCLPLFPLFRMSQRPPSPTYFQRTGSQHLAYSASAARRVYPFKRIVIGGCSKRARATCSPPCADVPPLILASAHPNRYLFDSFFSESLSLCFLFSPGRDPESDRRVVAHPPAEYRLACSAGRADGWEYSAKSPEGNERPQQNSPRLYTMPDPQAYDCRYAPPSSRKRSTASEPSESEISSPGVQGFAVATA